MKMFKYFGLDYNRIYVVANSLEEAMSKNNRKKVWKNLSEYFVVADFDDLRYNYNKVFSGWHNPDNWQQGDIFVDSAY